MRSGFYLSFIRHHRLIPKEYKFDYRFFWSYFNLDEIDELSNKHFFFSRNKFNLLSFYDGDHFDLEQGNVKENVLAFLKSQGVLEEIIQIELLTQPRLLGYTFNPVSYFFIKGKEKEYLVIEIGNTFSETKPYLVGPDCFSNNEWNYRTKKEFYISPFTSVRNQLHFRMKKNDPYLSISIDDYRETGEIEIKTNYQGKFLPWNNKTILKLLVSHPLLPFRIITSIHWHALILYLKKIPFYKKSDLKNDQRDLFIFDGKSFKKPKA